MNNGCHQADIRLYLVQTANCQLPIDYYLCQHLRLAMDPNPSISFDNTQNAFAYKTDGDLKRARFLFKSMSYAWLVKIGTRITPWAIRSGLPIKGVIRKTIFKQFVGGETLDETANIARKLGGFGVQVILDYGV